MPFEHALQAARSLGAAGTAVRNLERAKWRLWHGNWPGCRRRLAALCRWAGRESVRELAGADRLRRQVVGLLGYLGRNEAALMPYAARCQRDEPIATSFVEGAVDEIIAWRTTKKQQMSWTKVTVQPSLDVRTTVLNSTFEDTFRRRNPGFRPANDDRKPIAAAA